MFEDLNEQMKHDELATASPKENVLKWTIGGLISLLVLAGFYLISIP